HMRGERDSTDVPYQNSIIDAHLSLINEYNISDSFQVQYTILEI
ncbi:2340_t:CDS:1, partial [Acaulospora morrowiae]